MNIPIVSQIITTLNEWHRKSNLKSELRMELEFLYEVNIFENYGTGESFGSIYASIEKRFIEHGLTKEEIEKVDKSITVVAISG